MARSLANQPALVIADEPTGELDSTTGAQIFALLRDVAAAGVTVIAATHDPFVMEHVDRVLEMSDGRLLPEGEGLIVSQHVTKRSAPSATMNSTGSGRADVPPARPSPR